LPEKYGFKLIITWQDVLQTSLILGTGLYKFWALPGDLLLGTQYVASCIVLSHNQLSEGSPFVMGFLTPYTPCILFYYKG